MKNGNGKDEFDRSEVITINTDSASSSLASIGIEFTTLGERAWKASRSVRGTQRHDRYVILRDILQVIKLTRAGLGEYEAYLEALLRTVER